MLLTMNKFFLVILSQLINCQRFETMYFQGCLGKILELPETAPQASLLVVRQERRVRFVRKTQSNITILN
jgi:hypothetical protein